MKKRNTNFGHLAALGGGLLVSIFIVDKKSVGHGCEFIAPLLLEKYLQMVGQKAR